MRTQGPLPRCLNRIPRTGLSARPHIRSRLCPQALRVGVPRHPAETSAATYRDTPSDTSASEIRPRARPIRGTRPPYRSLVRLPRRMSFRLPVPPLNRLFAQVLLDEGQRPRAGVHLAILTEPRPFASEASRDRVVVLDHLDRARVKRAAIRTVAPGLLCPGAGEDAPIGGQVHRQLRTRRGNRPDRELRASLHDHDVLLARKRAVASAGRILIDGQVDAAALSVSLRRPAWQRERGVEPCLGEGLRTVHSIQDVRVGPGLAADSLMPAL